MFGEGGLGGELVGLAAGVYFFAEELAGEVAVGGEGALFLAADFEAGGGVAEADGGGGFVDFLASAA